jgi:hypothetical protein
VREGRGQGKQEEELVGRCTVNAGARVERVKCQYQASISANVFPLGESTLLPGNWLCGKFD